MFRLLYAKDAKLACNEQGKRKAGEHLPQQAVSTQSTRVRRKAPSPARLMPVPRMTRGMLDSIGTSRPVLVNVSMSMSGIFHREPGRVRNLPS